jgi:hypothetical protein
VLNGSFVQIEDTPDGLTLTLLRRALWFMSQRGVLIWKPLTGDFVISADVRTGRASDPSQPPGADGRVELAGLMARADSSRESYVHIVVGADPDGLSVETKTTTLNVSTFDGPDWASAEASLRICRAGSTFTMWKRPIGSSPPWTLAATYERPDLPDELMVGLNIYSDSTPDFQAVFEPFEIAAPPAAGCSGG